MGFTCGGLTEETNMANKKKSGRPISNLRLHEIMREQSCSRVWAYKLLRREQQVTAEKNQVPLLKY